MALVSPGISISVNDQSQYVNSNVGSVPLVILATAQDKSYNGASATGTTKAMAGMLQSFTSQRDLVTAMGTPKFQLSSAGTPLNGSELNEYGLLAAYSALGISNQLFAIRADIDLNQLTGTSVRPQGNEADGTFWLNLASTEFGIYSLNATNGSFSNVGTNLLTITDPSQVADDSNFAYNVPTPISSIGNQGSYALVFVDHNGNTPDTIRLFYKASALSAPLSSLANQWVQVGSTNWQNSVPTLVGTVAPGGSNPALVGSSSLTINTVGVTTGAGVTTVTGLASAINVALGPNAGVTAVATSNGLLALFATSSAKSNGSVADGKIVVTDGANTPLSKCGIANGNYFCPYFFYGSYAQTPSGGWFATDSQPRPSGSIWWKTTSTGIGWSPVVSQYSASQDSWIPATSPAYVNRASAIANLDSTGGGINITAGQVVAVYQADDTTSNGLKFLINSNTGPAIGNSSTPVSFASGNTYTLQSSVPGLSTLNSVSITTSGTSAQSFVADILNANIPYVTAQINNNGTIGITHTLGGVIYITQTSGAPFTNAGFVTNTTGSTGYTTGYVNGTAGVITISNFSNVTADFAYSSTTPAAIPNTGTLWYYSNPADIDIMINNNGWKGYQNVSADIRGYNLGNTDPAGVIISASQPTSQTDGTTLVPGDLWLDSSDLINYPKLSRVTAVINNVATWSAIDKTDQVSNNGIVFADARWDGTGTIDPISGVFPSTVSLLKNNVVDQDAPDYRLYPRGTLLFNTRRSGFNVKKFVANYFNATSFPNPGTIPGSSGTLPTVANAWVSVSGLQEDGSMYAGAAAQRNLVVTAMLGALNSNTDVLDANYKFNLLVAPGYPELIPGLVTLNDNRGSTGFIIGDTPMTLSPTATDLTAWNNNTGKWAGKGLATASAYLGIYYPSGLTSDLTGNTVAVPASHAVLRTFLYNDQVSYPWFAPAGVNRGLISNLSDIGYVNSVTGEFVHAGINQGLRDSLYTLNINPITQLPGVGLVVWGQETRSGDSTARNRVNVVRLENYLRVIFSSISNAFLFEPNDTITRKTIATQIENALNNLLSLRGLYDFLVICDTSNNTSATISNNQLFVDVAIEPMRDVEFIYIPIAIYNPGTIRTLGTAST